MVTKYDRIKQELVYNPVPLHIQGTCAIAKYIRITFNTSYYMSRKLTEYVKAHRRAERARLENSI